VYAALTTTHGSNEDMRELAVAVGEEMYRWLCDLEGFRGLMLLTNEETGTSQVLALWESREVAEHQRASRLSLRDRVTAAVNVEVQDTVGYEVSFAQFTTPPE